MLAARLLVLAAAVLFSTGGAAIKGTTWNAWQVSGGRSLIALCAILLLIPDARRWHLRYAPVAVAYAGTMVMFVAATKLTTAANAIFLQDTAPLFVLLFGPLFLKERIHRADLVLMAAVGCGMALFFTAHEAVRATAPDPMTGNLLAAGAAVTWAFTLIGLRWIGRGIDRAAGMATVAMGNLLAAAITLPMAFPMPAVRSHDVLVLGWLGLFQVGLAYLCLTRGVEKVPAFEATTLLLLEPALNPIWAWLIHGEKPATQAVAGGAIIVSATLGNAWWQQRRRAIDAAGK